MLARVVVACLLALDAISASINIVKPNSVNFNFISGYDQKKDIVIKLGANPGKRVDFFMAAGKLGDDFIAMDPCSFSLDQDSYEQGQVVTVMIKADTLPNDRFGTNTDITSSIAIRASDGCEVKDTSVPMVVSLPKFSTFSSSGDPHFWGLNGTYYHNQDQGWKTLLRTEKTWAAAFQAKCGARVTCNSHYIVRDDQKTYFLTSGSGYRKWTLSDNIQVTIHGSYIALDVPSNYAAKLGSNSGIAGLFQKGSALAMVPPLTAAEPFDLETCWQANANTANAQGLGTTCVPPSVMTQAALFCAALPIPDLSACQTTTNQENPTTTTVSWSEPTATPSAPLTLLSAQVSISTMTVDTAVSLDDKDIETREKIVQQPCHRVLTTYPNCTIQPEESEKLKIALSSFCVYDIDVGAANRTEAMQTMIGLYTNTCLEKIASLTESSIEELQQAGAALAANTVATCKNGGELDATGFGCKCQKGFIGFDCSLSESSFENFGNGASTTLIVGVAAAACLTIGAAFFSVRQRRNRLLTAKASSVSISVPGGSNGSISARENPLYVGPQV